jgi:microcystin-dependent protein
MSQFDPGTIDPNTKDGATLASDINNWRDALHSSHRGTTAPGYASAGMLWVDDSAGTTWELKFYDGADWISLFTIDTTNNKTQLGSWSKKESKVTTKSASYTTVASDNGALINVDASSGNLTINLLAATTANDGHLLAIKKSDSSSNTVTLDPNSTETIDGATILVLENENDSALIMCDGMNWQVLAHKSASSATTSGFEAMAAGIPTPWLTNTAPTYTLAMNGQNVSRTTYSNLFAAISTTYGVGDGSTTFTLPDWRGEFIRGWDNTVGNDPDAASRTDRGDGTMGDSVGTKQTDEFKSHTHNSNDGTTKNGGFQYTTGSGWYGTKTSPTTATGGNETRPRNVYVNWVITTGGQ